MEIAKYILDEASKVLSYEGDNHLPTKLASSSFFLGKKDDETIIAFGVIEHNGVEYKIGPQKQ